MSTATGENPNVVFILVDDWGAADAGVLGSDFYETPNIDRFAGQSTRFTQAYAAAPICSPTRVAIMTGKSPVRLQMTIWHEGAVRGGPTDRRLLEPKAKPNLPREEVTLAELFRQRGYFTAHIGKWHLGRAAYYPETQGFDINIGGTCWGAPATFFYPYRGIWSEADPELRYVPAGMGQPGDYLTDRLTDHAVDVIERQQDSPFFLSLWFYAVHTPIEAKPERIRYFRNLPPGRNHNHPTYAAMLASLDENVGRILRKLDDLKLTDNTIVILTSDNGGVDFSSQRTGNRIPTQNTPFRSGKGTLYEGGIRVPLMIRWPGVSEPVATCDAPVTSQDFFPTFAETLGYVPHELPQHDGVSLLSMLQESPSTLPRKRLFWHYPHYYRRMTPGSAIRQNDWKLIHFYEDERMELYHVKEDAGETNDLSGQLPERVRAMRAALDGWRQSVKAGEPRRNPNWHVSLRP